MITIMLKIKDVEINLTLEEVKALREELDDLLGEKTIFPPTQPIIPKGPGVPTPPYFDNFPPHTPAEPLPSDWYKITC